LRLEWPYYSSIFHRDNALGVCRVYERGALDDLREAVRRSHALLGGVERHWLGHPPAFPVLVVVQVTSRTVEILDPCEGPRLMVDSMPKLGPLVLRRW
jgi:hypothetical protein